MVTTDRASSSIRSERPGARRSAHNTSYQESGGSPAAARRRSTSPVTAACAFSTAFQASSCVAGTSGFISKRLPRNICNDKQFGILWSLHVQILQRKDRRDGN